MAVSNPVAIVNALVTAEIRRDAPARDVFHRIPAANVFLQLEAPEVAGKIERAARLQPLHQGAYQVTMIALHDKIIAALVVRERRRIAENQIELLWGFFPPLAHSGTHQFMLARAKTVRGQIAAGPVQ